VRVIRPSMGFVTPLNRKAIMEQLEECDRVCYKSEDSTTKDDAEKFLKGFISRGHEAVLAHSSFTVKLICDRGTFHEIVGYMPVLYCQKSTRYCNCNQGQFDAEITVVKPCFLVAGTKAYDRWKKACSEAEEAYFDLLEWGCDPQEAGVVLPNSLKTEIVMMANIQVWRHFLKFGCSGDANPQLREIATQLLRMVHRELPVLFDDI